MRILSIDCGIKNLAYCIIHFDNESNAYSIEKWDILDIRDDEDDKKKLKHDFYAVTSLLVSRLHEVFLVEQDFDQFDLILIENQPVHRNPIMKSIQIVIYTFFMTNNYQLGHTSEIKLVSASNKLKVKDKPENVVVKASTKYQENKKLSVEYAKHYLANVLKDTENLRYFLSQKKKDDYADSFLQAVQYIEKRLMRC
jgi:biopolymer transport protein ExbD